MTGPALAWRAGPRWAACLLVILGLHAALVAQLMRRANDPAPVATLAEPVLLDLSPEPQPAVTPPVPLATAAPPELAPPPEPAPAAPPLTTPDSDPLPPPRQPVPSPPKHPRPPKPPARPPAPPSQAEATSPAAPPPSPSAPATAPAPRADPQAAASWRSLLMGRLLAAKRYPERARSRGDQGVALATFTMDRAGRVIAQSLVRSSGSALLDEEALALIHRAEPLPAPPADVPGATLTLTVPVSFALR